MHLLFFTRAVEQQRRLFEMFMETQMFVWHRKDLMTGKDRIQIVQGGLRKAPWGYEYVFPKECLAEVLTMLEIPSGEPSFWGMSKFKRWALRNLIGQGIKPIPKYEPIPDKYISVEGVKGVTEVVLRRFVEKKGVAIYPIGIKEDVMGTFEEFDPKTGERHLWQQEML